MPNSNVSITATFKKAQQTVEEISDNFRVTKLVRTYSNGETISQDVTSDLLKHTYILFNDITQRLLLLI